MTSVQELLQEMITLFYQSTLAYKNYLAGGKTYRFAKDLKFHNTKALHLLIENKADLPPDLQDDVQALIDHYTEWSAKWEKLAAEKEFSNDDEFAFPNENTFPREAAQRIEEAYEKFNPPSAAPGKF